MVSVISPFFTSRYSVLLWQGWLHARVLCELFTGQGNDVLQNILHDIHSGSHRTRTAHRRDTKFIQTECCPEGRLACVVRFNTNLIELRREVKS